MDRELQNTMMVPASKTCVDAKLNTRTQQIVPVLEQTYNLGSYLVKQIAYGPNLNHIVTMFNWNAQTPVKTYFLRAPPSYDLCFLTGAWLHSGQHGGGIGSRCVPRVVHIGMKNCSPGSIRPSTGEWMVKKQQQWAFCTS